MRTKHPRRVRGASLRCCGLDCLSLTTPEYIVRWDSEIYKDSNALYAIGCAIYGWDLRLAFAATLDLAVMLCIIAIVD
jgi:hypothetical protein